MITFQLIKFIDELKKKIKSVLLNNIFAIIVHTYKNHETIKTLKKIIIIL